MSVVAALAVRLAGAAAIAGIVALLLWRADRRLPPGTDAAVARPFLPVEVGAFCAGLLAAGIGNPRVMGLLAHLLRSALGCLLVAAIFWAMATPRLPVGFLADADAILRFAGRLLLSGLVTVLLVHWAAAAVIGPLSPRIARARAGGVLWFILLDTAVRLVALVVVTAATFALYAQVAGSFGGSWRTGLAVVPDTLVAALRLEGLSGIYVWAALLGGYPLVLVLLARLVARRGAGRVWQGFARLPVLRDRPAGALGLLLGVLAGAAALALSLALWVARAAGG